jgi:hypothetical protein
MKKLIFMVLIIVGLSSGISADDKNLSQYVPYPSLLGGRCAPHGFPGVCEYSLAYKELIWIFSNYKPICEPDVYLYITDLETTEVITADNKALEDTEFPMRILVIEYDGVNKTIHYLERNW